MAIVSATLALIGGYFVQLALQQRLNPILVKDVYRPDLSNLPQDIQRAIPLIPVKYSLVHSGGAAATDVTILVKGDAPLSAADLRFSPDSENHQCEQVEPRTVRIDVREIRPNGLLGFDMMVSVTNQVKFSELANSAKVYSAAEFEARKKNTSLIQTGIIVAIVLVWLTLLVAAGTLIWNMGKWWQKVESGVAPSELRNKAVLVILAIIFYDTVVNSLGPVSAFLPVPRISIMDFVWGIVLYFLITRFKLIEAWFASKPSSGPKNTSAETRDDFITRDV